jgi:hypothetical protein
MRMVTNRLPVLQVNECWITARAVPGVGYRNQPPLERAHLGWIIDGEQGEPDALNPMSGEGDRSFQSHRAVSK